MAAYNLHRKVIEDPANATEAAEICSFQCDPIQNTTGNCSSICSYICPLSCNITNSSPPPPPWSNDGYIFTTPPKHHHSPLSLPLKISLVILILTFSLFLLYTLYKFYTVWYRSRRQRSPPSPENQETNEDFLDHDIIDHPVWYIRTIGLQPSVISAITVVKYNKSDEIIDGTFCSVCLSDFQENETLRLLPKCNHAFHISCIDTWLRSHTNCPLCRAGIVKNTTNSGSSNQILDDSGRIEETQVAITITDEVIGEERQMEDNNQSFDEENKVDAVGGSGTSEFLIIRRSVSLNDYAGCRIRPDVHDNNNYYSDRHEIQIQSIEGDLGSNLCKVEQTPNNCSTEEH